MEIRRLNLEQDIQDFELFVSEIRNNRENQHFRYFSNRDISVVFDHLVTFIIKEKSDIIGYAHLEFERKHWFGIYVAPSFRGLGLGKMLWLSIKNYALETGVGLVYLTVDNDNKIAINMYKKMGFLEVDRTKKYTEFRYDTIK